MDSRSLFIIHVKYSSSFSGMLWQLSGPGYEHGLMEITGFKEGGKKVLKKVAVVI